MQFYSEYLGQGIDISDLNYLKPLLYAKDYSELIFLWQIIENENLVSGLSIKSGQFTRTGVALILTRNGIQLLKGSTTNLKQIFVAMAFTKDMHSQFDYELIASIKDATGFTLKLVSHIEHNDLIDDQIIAEINRSDALIADFSDNNEAVLQTTNG